MSTINSGLRLSLMRRGKDKTLMAIDVFYSVVRILHFTGIQNKLSLPGYVRSFFVQIFALLLYLIYFNRLDLVAYLSYP